MKCSDCRRQARKGSSLCTTCDKKRWRLKYPMKASFQTLRHNARRRGKPFTITFEYFQKFCRKYNYMAGKGRSKESYTVDCIDPKLGYVQGNIQCLPKSENSSKGTKVLHYDWHSKTATVIENFRQKETVLKNQ